MKKLLTLCAFVSATLAVALEMPSRDELNAMIKEHIVAMEQAPKEEWLDLDTKFNTFMRQISQERAEAQDPEYMRELDCFIVFECMLPCHKAFLAHETLFSPEEKEEIAAGIAQVEQIRALEMQSEE